MAVKIAINGFGRVGRLAFRQMFGSPDFDIVAVNDLASPKMLAYLLEYDSAHGRYGKKVQYTQDSLVIDGSKISVCSEKDPKALPWGRLDADIVVECTGLYTSKMSAASHIDAGAKKVVISAPAGGDLPTIVYGVNENILKSTDTIISTASCTTNCLALMVNILNCLAPLQKGFMTTIHAYTNDQNTLDSPHPKEDLRRARAAAVNIIPQPTGAAKTIGLVIPALSGRLDGLAQRVPVITGSVTELVAVVEGAVTREQINDSMKSAASDSFGYTDDEIVSSDVIGITYGALFDSTQTKVTDLRGSTLVKIAAWYDNENSYVSQMIRTVKYFGSF
jgi:glyceraldehyde 3-phosphate dehydrogenase